MHQVQSQKTVFDGYLRKKQSPGFLGKCEECSLVPRAGHESDKFKVRLHEQQSCESSRKIVALQVVERMLLVLPP